MISLFLPSAKHGLSCEWVNELFFGIACLSFYGNVLSLQTEINSK